MTYLFLHLIMYYYAFIIVSLTWLAYFLSHHYHSYTNSPGFFSLWRRAYASNVRHYYPYRHPYVYICFCISTVPTQSTTFILLLLIYAGVHQRTNVLLQLVSSTWCSKHWDCYLARTSLDIWWTFLVDCGKLFVVKRGDVLTMISQT